MMDLSTEMVRRMIKKIYNGENILVNFHRCHIGEDTHEHYMCIPQTLILTVANLANTK